MMHNQKEHAQPTSYKPHNYDTPVSSKLEMLSLEQYDGPRSSEWWISSLTDLIYVSRITNETINPFKRGLSGHPQPTGNRPWKRT